MPPAMSFDKANDFGLDAFDGLHAHQLMLGARKIGLIDRSSIGLYPASAIGIRRFGFRTVV